MKTSLSKVKPIVEYLTIIKGAWEMFSFFSDMKSRVLAVEQKIEVIWQHLFTKVEAVEEAPPTTEEANRPAEGDNNAA